MVGCPLVLLQCLKYPQFRCFRRWTYILWSIPLFWGLKRFQLLRIEGYNEFYGMDLTQHGESAYPASAWDEDQYKDASGRQSGPGPMRQNSKNIEWEENPIHKRRSMESPI